jgi:hypothetical protein
MRVWRGYKALGHAAIERFARERHIDPQVMLNNDVVQVNDRAIGFGYRDPETLAPCRIKVRTIDKKSFWIEPRGDGGVALSPLYLAHDLNGCRGVILTEGELDALTLRGIGMHNVVSLPDGVESAGLVSVDPLARYDIWLVSFDDDDPGRAAYKVMRERARRWGKAAVRLVWRDGQTSYKDANEAASAGKDRGWFDQRVFDLCDGVLGVKVTV